MSAPRILLVDDQRDVSRMLRSTLELSGREYTVIDVPSGEEALLELGRGPVDLLVTDLRLPGISGLELLERVRQLNPEARAILITGHPTEEARARAEALGVIAFLQKPLGTSFFLEIVERALQLSGAPRAPVRVTEEAQSKLEKVIGQARNALGAEALLLIDESGQVAASVGSLQALDLEAAMPSLMATIDAGLKTSSLLGSLLPGNLHYFDGDTHHLYLTNVGAYYALLIVFRGGQAGGQLGAVVHFGRRAAEALMDLLSSLGPDQEPPSEAESLATPEIAAPAAAVEPPTPSESPIPQDELDLDSQILHQQDAEQYWERAANGTPSDAAEEGDMLTYHEARERGLLPEEPQDES